MRLPAEAGVMVLNTVLFPRGILPLHIFEPRYRAMLSAALDSDRMFAIARPEPGAGSESPTRIAGVGMVRYSRQRPNGTSDLVLEGVARIRLGTLVHLQPYRRHAIEGLTSVVQSSPAIEELVMKCREFVETQVQQGFQLPIGWAQSPAGSAPQSFGPFPDAGAFADFVGGIFLRHRPEAMQALLEDLVVESRLQRLVQFLSNGAAEGA